MSANAVQGVAAATKLGTLVTAPQPLFEAIRWVGIAHLTSLAVQASPFHGPRQLPTPG